MKALAMIFTMLYCTNLNRLFPHNSWSNHSIPQLVVPTLALLGEEVDSPWGAFFRQGWWLVGCAGDWVEQAWQLGILRVAKAGHMLHTQQDPCGEEGAAVSRS